VIAEQIVNLNYDTALRLGAAGIRVFPACPETKAPLVRKIKSASLYPNVLEMWWRDRPDAMPAIYVAGSDLIAIDLDVGHKEGVDGVAAFCALVEQHGGLPLAPLTRTPRGGLHVYFRQPVDDPYLSNCTTGLPDGIDIRADPRNGYTIAPGAVMATGEYYETVEGDLAEMFMAGTVPELPRWIPETIDRAVAEKIEAAQQFASHVGAMEGVVSDYRLRAVGIAALDGEARKLAATGVGNRNNTLNKCAYTLAGHAGRIS
jgi:putative DNA primase/helicase